MASAWCPPTKPLACQGSPAVVSGQGQGDDAGGTVNFSCTCESAACWLDSTANHLLRAHDCPVLLSQNTRESGSRGIGSQIAVHAQTYNLLHCSYPKPRFSPTIASCFLLLLGIASKHPATASTPASSASPDDAKVHNHSFSSSIATTHSTPFPDLPLT